MNNDYITVTEELAAEIFALFASEPFSRALAYRLYHNGWRKLPIKSNNSEVISNNYEQIKQMTVKELAEFLCGLMCSHCCEENCPATNHCSSGHNGMPDWLESEVET